MSHTLLIRQRTLGRNLKILNPEYSIGRTPAIMSKNFSCYNCGQQNNHFSRDCPILEQQFTRCPECNNVAKTAIGHKLACSNSRFVSTKIGAYDLPLMLFHNVTFTFQNVEKIFVAQSTSTGVQNFLISKFFALGTNIRLCRIFGQSGFTLKAKIKPAVSFGLGRVGKVGHMASLMLCDNQVRVNHHQHVDRTGTVSYALTTFPRTDESHDLELKLSSKSNVIFFTLCWNDMWTANIAMSSSAVTIGSCDKNRR